MPVSVQWLLAIITIVSSGASVKLWTDRLKKQARDEGAEVERLKQLLQLRQSLTRIRMMCVQASELGTIIRTEAEKQFVRNIGHDLLAVEIISESCWATS
jgi:hypothetical protein